MNIAINGFGRIGRLFFRQAFGKPGLKIIAINDLGDSENLAYLLTYDSVYGVWDKNIKVDIATHELLIAGERISFIQEKELTKLPWGKLGVDIVLEATGAFESFEKSRAHLEAGAKRVVISAPAKDDEQSDARTILNGVNEDLFKSSLISSNGSCTTNSASPIVSILSENPGIEKAMLATTHGYTATQRIVDGPDAKDWRRGRAAAHNIVPSTTGAAISVTRAVETLKGKFDGLAVRVPVIAGSLSDITFLAKRNVTADEINAILRTEAQTSRWKDILKVTSDPVVSSDIIGQPYGAIVDATLTKVVAGNLVKVMSWYDNEWGYVHTLVKHIEKVGATLS